MILYYFAWTALVERVAASPAVELAHPAHLAELALLLTVRLFALFGAPVLLSALLLRAVAARLRSRW